MKPSFHYASAFGARRSYGLYRLRLTTWCGGRIILEPAETCRDVAEMEVRCLPWRDYVVNGRGVGCIILSAAAGANEICNSAMYGPAT